VSGWKPVIAVPGLNPKSPVMTVGPVLVTVEPPRTAKSPAVPRPTDGPGTVASAVVAVKKPAVASITNIGKPFTERIKNIVKAPSKVETIGKVLDLSKVRAQAHLAGISPK
jgi:hypothetical protein